MTRKDARSNPVSQEHLFLRVTKIIWRSFIFESPSSWILYHLWHRICMCVCEREWSSRWPRMAFNGILLFLWFMVCHCVTDLEPSFKQIVDGHSKYYVYTWGFLMPSLPCHKNVANFLIVFMGNIVGDGIMGEGWVTGTWDLCVLLVQLLMSV